MAAFLFLLASWGTIMVVDSAQLYFIARLACVPNRRRYWVVTLLVFSLLSMFKERFLAVGVVVFVCMLVLPWLLCGGSRGRRTLVVALATVVMACCECLVSVIWLLVSRLPLGQESSMQAAPVLFFALRALVAVINVWLADMLARPFASLAAKDDRRGHRVRSAVFTWRFAVLAVVQACITATLLYLQEFELNNAPVVSVGVLLVGAANVLVLAALAVAVLYLRDVETERARARDVEEQLAGTVELYEELSARAAQAARLRHDARNHATVLMALVDRGELAAAETYLDDVRETYR